MVDRLERFAVSRESFWLGNVHLRSIYLYLHLYIVFATVNVPIYYSRALPTPVSHRKI